jgi:hypothetical protein
MTLTELLALIDERRNQEHTEILGSYQIVDCTGGIIVQAYDERNQPRTYTSHPGQFFLDEVRENNWTIKACDKWEQLNGGNYFDVIMA